ncbi:T9SS-dependent M36 family metallopeptidase [Hymenobacter bucti]|uniref:T9SS-dependent M36 family metallopeptidase n=1 Tax=Hymenobacter bucti TaxID=1844114 RepID=A0ABW4QUX2_9BACT
MKKLIPIATRLGLSAVLLGGSYSAYSQSKTPAPTEVVPQAALEHLRKNKQALRLTDTDLADVVLSGQSVSKNSGVKHIYLQQRYQGIEIHNAVSNVNLTKDDEVLNVGDRFQKDASHRVAARQSAPLAAPAAVAAAARHVGLALKQDLAVQKQTGAKNGETVFSTAGIALEPITAKLVYQPLADGSLRLAWEVSIYELSAQNWWEIRVDAATGELLEKDNLVVHCEFDNDGPAGVPLGQYSASAATKPAAFNFAAAVATAAATGTYRVFPLVTESPSHGPRVLVGADAADPLASPEGWHYAPGGNFTTTRGNNVYAYEDPNNNNSFATNYSPDGGAGLVFDFPLDLTQQPVTYRDAATTNLFYWSNIMHDVWYQYGFDEGSANFQLDNFANGRLGSDPVLAEAQDSRNIPVPPPGVTTRNNANFSTPRDGVAPRMQMYLWSGIPDRNLFQVTTPAGIAGSYPALEGTFSRPLTAVPVTGQLVLAQTTPPATTALSEEGCGPYLNGAAISGNIAVVYRGTCGFADKVQNAQKAGAIAVVVINNAPGAPISMGGTPTTALPAIVIPAVMISQADGQTIRNLLNAQTVVTVALKNSGSGPEIDGDFDNGIIAHEYGHGISTRLTGGGLNVACLRNAEQAGEGWSDWFGLMLTTKPGDTGAKSRGIGTYASGQPTTARGIRPAPYSTDFAVNNFTYGATNNTAAIAAPHGIGFVWATMIWDMNWALVDKYGYDADLYKGTGGNNKAMALVIEGLKLQPCSPGFVDARDAILAADVAINKGANQELIWKVFARRGLGFSAKQGLSTSRTDQVESFDLPPVYACSSPTITVSPANAGFTGAAAKTIYLGYGAQSVTLTASGDPTFTYSWSPAKGLSNPTIANPVFTPTAAGSYTFTVTAVNASLCTRTASVTINVIDVRCGNKLDKVTVCHKGKALCIGADGVADHLGHGDMVGACDKQATPSLQAGGDEVAQALQLTASPNPTNARTTLDFTLVESSSYRLEVINMQGARVAVVAEGSGEAGESFSHEFSRGPLAPGLYMVRLVAGKQSKATKLILQD